MKELVVRWYQFGAFCPIFRTHGIRSGTPDPVVPPCVIAHREDPHGPNEVWAYGNDTQLILEKYVRLRATMKPYIRQLAENVTASGVPTMRPLWYEFPADKGSVGINDQYLLGPDYLVAPVTIQGATSRTVYFPAGASWKNMFNPSDVVTGGVSKTVPAPLDTIPVYIRA